MPTEVEHRHLIRQSRFSFDAQCELCGFGPVSAAASTATLIARHQPERVLLTGIAGTFDPDALPVGTAAVFSKVVMYGVGIGAGDVFRSASGAELRIGDELSLMSPVRPVAGALHPPIHIALEEVVEHAGAAGDQRRAGQELE